MLIRATDDFRFEWPDPADAHLVWIWDQMHNPRPLPPIAADIFSGWMARIMGGRRIVVNGYVYNSFGTPPPPRPAGEQALPLSQPPSSFSPFADALSIWKNEHLPRIRAIISSIRDRDYASMPAARLAGMLGEIIAGSGDAFGLTFGAVMTFGIATNMLIDFCEREVGPDGAVRAATMIQGYENESSASGAALSSLTELAASLAAVAAALKDRRFDDIRSVEGGETFAAELDAYLREYGCRVTTWGELHRPTWAEDPTVPLTLIARYLADSERAPAAALRRAVAQREATILETESRLDPEKRDRFRKLLKAAQAHVPVSEGRALWQLIIGGTLRIPLLALGDKLVAEGRVDRPDDVFFFETAELIDLSTGRPTPNARGTASGRRADLERWGRLIPPRHLGAPPPPGMLAGMYRFFGYGVEQSPDARVINGIAASKGVVMARARVILDLSDSDRLGPGEVLVCPSTAPPWTPLFAIAGAVVTDSGGVLSHSAIAAREYAIPAVVGAQVATRRIPDGAIVTVDGGQGVVRIEEEA